MLNTNLQKILDNEFARQNSTLDLIASENYTSTAVREAVGSVFMHKYSEGYPGVRYYEGNEYIDELENLVINLVKKVFNLPKTWGVNVQALAGSNANLAVYNAILNPGDKILSMYLPDGGHLSHGWSYASKDEKDQQQIEDKVYRGGSRKVNIVSKFYNVVQYKTDPQTFLIDYDFLEELAVKEQPKLIITGGTAYVREIDYSRVAQIAKKVEALYLADVAHEAGLIAGQALSSPIGIANVVTFTTHKTLRGPKGAIVCGEDEIIEKINKSIMPGLQGGPHNGTIAGIAQCLFEADTQEFKVYAKQVVENAKTLATELSNYGFNLITGGTDKHSILIDLTNKGISGKFASYALNASGIVTNMNTIPYETKTPINPSGIRLGTPSITTRGFGKQQIIELAKLINTVIDDCSKFGQQDFDSFKSSISLTQSISDAKSKVEELCKTFPFKS
jgi:glycine hydroxymethyltransferase